MNIILCVINIYYMYFQFWHNVCALYHGNMFITLVKEHHYLKVPYAIHSVLNTKRCISLLWKVYRHGLCFILHYLLRIIFPWGSMLEGVVVWNVEHYMGDYGMFTKVSMDYTIVVSHNLDTYITQYPSQSPFFRLKNLKYKDIMTIVGPYVWILISS